MRYFPYHIRSCKRYTMIYLLIISCMQILGTSAITLFLASVEIEEAFACSTNSINAQS